MRKPKPEYELFELVMNMIEKNHRFTQENPWGKTCYAEIIGLTNDIIKSLGFFIRKDREDPRVFLTSAMYNNVQFMLMPFSYGIYVNFLAGSFQACFAQLRLMTEAIAESLYVDAQYDPEDSYVTKMKKLEHELRDRSISISKFFKTSFSDVAGKESAKEVLKMWGKLSESWLHPRGYGDTIIDRIKESGSPPSWALLIPAVYSKVDEADCEELHNRIKEFREILKQILDKWQSKSHYRSL